jgi:hypothetical protein
MRFLSSAEWQSWCSERQVPLREVGSIRPDISADHFHVADLPYRSDSGAKIGMARFLYSLVAPEPETLLLVDELGSLAVQSAHAAFHPLPSASW